MKIGGGGNERYMIVVPAVIGTFIIVYALGGVGSTLIILEDIAQDSLAWVKGLL